MDKKHLKQLDAKGWQVGNAEDFLEMSPAEKQLLDIRVSLALAVRHYRELNNISQAELALKLKTSQPRVAMIERGAKSVSLDQLFKAATAAGATITLQADSKETLKKSPLSKAKTKKLPAKST